MLSMLFENLTDTDSCSFFYIFVCEDGCFVKECEANHLIFKVLKNSKIVEKIHSSYEIWKLHNLQKPELQKQAGLYEIELIDNPNISTISINPKEYYEEFRKRAYNTKTQGNK